MKNETKLYKQYIRNEKIYVRKNKLLRPEDIKVLMQKKKELEKKE
jgi:hypothetical protein